MLMMLMIFEQPLSGLSMGPVSSFAFPAAQVDGDDLHQQQHQLVVSSGGANAGQPELDPMYAKFRDQSRFWIQRVAVPLLMVIGLFGNSITIIIMTRRRMRSTTNMYLAALALVDMLYLLLVFLLGLSHYPNMAELKYYAYWRLRPFLMMLTDACSNTSVWLTVTFTMERYIAVKYPMKGKLWCTEERAKMLIVAVFLFGILFASPVPFEWKVIEKRVSVAPAGPAGGQEASFGHQTGNVSRAMQAISATDSVDREQNINPNSQNRTHNSTGGIPKDVDSDEDDEEGEAEEDDEEETDRPKLAEPGGQPASNSVTEKCLLGLDYSDFGRNETYKTVYYWSTAVIFYFVPLFSLMLFNGFLIKSVHQSRRERTKMTTYGRGTSSKPSKFAQIEAKNGAQAQAGKHTQSHIGILVNNRNGQLADYSVSDRSPAGAAELNRSASASVIGHGSPTRYPHIGRKLKQLVSSSRLKLAREPLKCRQWTAAADGQQSCPLMGAHSNNGLATEGAGEQSTEGELTPGSGEGSTDAQANCDNGRLGGSVMIASEPIAEPPRSRALSAVCVHHLQPSSPANSSVSLASTATTIQQHKQQQPQAQHQSGGHSSSSSSQERRITIMLIAVVILFLLCQIPSAAMLLYTSVRELVPNTNEHALVLAFGNIFNFLMAVNAAGNFILYSFLSKKYRRTFLILFCDCLKDANKGSGRAIKRKPNQMTASSASLSANNGSGGAQTTNRVLSVRFEAATNASSSRNSSLSIHQAGTLDGGGSMGPARRSAAPKGGVVCTHSAAPSTDV